SVSGCLSSSDLCAQVGKRIEMGLLFFAQPVEKLLCGGIRAGLGHAQIQVEGLDFDHHGQFQAVLGRLKVIVVTGKKIVDFESAFHQAIGCGTLRFCAQRFEKPQKVLLVVLLSLEKLFQQIPHLGNSAPLKGRSVELLEACFKPACDRSSLYGGFIPAQELKMQFRGACSGPVLPGLYSALEVEDSVKPTPGQKMGSHPAPSADCAVDD